MSLVIFSGKFIKNGIERGNDIDINFIFLKAKNFVFIKFSFILQNPALSIIVQANFSVSIMLTDLPHFKLFFIFYFEII